MTLENKRYTWDSIFTDMGKKISQYAREEFEKEFAYNKKRELRVQGKDTNEGIYSIIFKGEETILKYRLEKWENVLIFQVLDNRQLDKVRFEASNNYIIEVGYDMTSIDFQGNVIKLFNDRYTGKYPMKASLKHFTTNEARDICFKGIQQALSEWADSLLKINSDNEYTL